MIVPIDEKPPHDAIACDSPAILRLKMLEAKHAAANPISASARQSAYDLIGALKLAIAEKPSLTFVDVVAKLKTCDELARDRIGEKVEELQISMIRSALADLRRLPPSV